MVIARELRRALRDAGHDAHIIVTPQNRFGRQASAYVATWLTDLGASERPIDQVISLRYPSYAVRHSRHVCRLNHTMREYYDLWDRFSASLSPQGLAKERVRRAVIHAADRYLLTRNVSRLFVQSKVADEFVLVITGEGDAFCAGILLGLHEGWDLAQCLHAGVCVAAASLSHPTCTGGMTAALSAVAMLRSSSRNCGRTSDDSDTSTSGYSSPRICCMRCSWAGLA